MRVCYWPLPALESKKPQKALVQTTCLVEATCCPQVGLNSPLGIPPPHPVFVCVSVVTLRLCVNCKVPTTIVHAVCSLQTQACPLISGRLSDGKSQVGN